mgnify:CR=1 FL=1
MNINLSKYFNKQTCGGIGVAPTAIVCGAAAIFLMSTGSPIGIGLAFVHTAVAAGYANKWKEIATGTPIWKPRTPILGL